MVAPVFDIEVEGSEAVIKNLDQINSKGANLSPAFSRIAGVLETQHHENFESQGAIFGNRWPKRKLAYRWPILKKTGVLSRSFASSYTATSATVTNTVKYAKYHQLGTSRLPVRGIIGLAGSGGKDSVNEAIRILRQHIGV